MSDAIIVREWNVQDVHRRVLEYERQGYVARRDTYRITADTNPETGEVIHLYVIEMFAPNLPDEKSSSTERS
jgi:hypothetical protein